MFMLMLAELFAFLVLNSNYNSLGQSLSVATGSQNIGSSLQLGSRDFAGQSLQKAISVLAAYEYNSSLRKGNFVSNFSYYVSNLMINGMLPNATSMAQNAVRQQMGGLTFNAYNLSVLKAYQLSGGLSINQTRPYIYQASPYTISVEYTQNVRVNSSAGTYLYGIPVNATLNLTGEPDLFYAQQGIMRYLNFVNLSTQVSKIGGINATTGSLYNFAYGTANLVASGAGSCPSAFGAASNSIILVTQNAAGITSSGCENSFGGLITTSNTISNTPTIPYLGYPPSTNIQQLFGSGSSVLLYGPGRAAFDIEALRNSIANGYYFASPATASFGQWASAQTSQSSPQGIFTLGTYNQQAGQFNGASSISANSPSSLTGTGSVCTWFYPSVSQSSSTAYTLADFGTAGSNTHELDFLVDIPTYNGLAVLNAVGGTEYTLKQGGSPVTPGSWHLGCVTWTGSNMYLYLDGNLSASNTQGTTDSLAWSSTFHIGLRGGGANQYWLGQISNMQIYNTSLSKAQISSLYREGVDDLPPSNKGLVGWWPLNGNANDYSGQGNNGANSGVVYTLASSGFPTMSASNFNGQSSYISIPFSAALDSGSKYTVSAWVKTTSSAANQLVYSAWAGASTGYQVSVNSGNAVILVGSGAISATVPINNGNWQNVIGVFSSGGTGYVYVNGAQVASGSTNSITESGSSQIGVQYTGSAYNDYFNGIISNVQVYNTAFSVAQANTLYKAGIDGAPLNGAGIVGWWLLNGNANDYSRNGNVGMPTNVVFTQYVGGVTDSLTGSSYYNLYPLPGVLSCYNLQGCYNASLHNVYLSNYPIVPTNSLQAGQFNGASSYIATGTGNLPTGSAARSVFGWVHWTGVFSLSWPSQYIYDYGSSASGQQSALGIYPTNVIYFSDYANNAISTLAITPSVWHFVGYTYSAASGNVVLYLDGQSQSVAIPGGATSTAIPALDPSDIGKQSGNCNCLYFNGTIANLQVYNTALSTAQANTLYQEGIYGSPILPSNTVGWWSLNGNANDYSGNGNDGTSDQNVAYPYVAQNVSSTANFWQALGFGVQPK